MAGVASVKQEVNQYTAQARQVYDDLAKVGEVRQYAKLYGMYFGVIVVLRLLRSWKMFLGVGTAINLVGGTVLFLLGGVVGLLVSYIDRLVYVYYSRPNEPLSVEVKKLVEDKKYKEVFKTLFARGNEQKHLSMNNVLFLGVWVVLSVFLVSSSPSMFAKGLVLGIGLDLAQGLVRDWKRPAYLTERLFWPVKRKVTRDELKVVVATFGGVFILVSVMGI